MEVFYFIFLKLIIKQTNERLLGTNNCFLYDVIPSFDKLIFINRALFTITAMLSRNRINLLKINNNSMTEQPICFEEVSSLTYFINARLEGVLFYFDHRENLMHNTQFCGFILLHITFQLIYERNTCFMAHIFIEQFVSLKQTAQNNEVLIVANALPFA